MILLLFLLGQLLLGEKPGLASPSTMGTTDVLGILNRSALSYFLASNLATGAVNLCIDTLSTNDYVAVVILSGYQLLLVAGARTYVALSR